MPIQWSKGPSTHIGCSCRSPVKDAVVVAFLEDHQVGAAVGPDDDLAGKSVLVDVFREIGDAAERLFAEDVPTAEDSNAQQYQSMIDFSVGGFTVDIKASRLHPARQERSGKTTAPRWMFSINKQKDKADFFVMYAFDFAADRVEHVFLVPAEIATTKSTIVVPESLSSKWADYRVDRNDLADFFRMLVGEGGEPVRRAA